jgi:membrane glycosyltransferase
VRRLWPQTVLGWGVIITLAMTAPAAIPVALLVAGGLAVAIPLAVITADPAVGRLLLRIGLGRLPEETLPSPLDALTLPALASRKRGAQPPSAEPEACSIG